VKGWDTYVGWHDAEGVKEFLMPDGSIRRGVLILDDSWWADIAVSKARDKLLEAFPEDPV